MGFAHHAKLMKRKIAKFRDAFQVDFAQDLPHQPGIGSRRKAARLGNHPQFLFQVEPTGNAGKGIRLVGYTPCGAI